MADELNSPAPTGGGEPAKVKQFVKKNKTLVIVAGLGGIYYLIKRNKEGGGTVGETAVSGEFSEEGSTPLNEQESVNAREQSTEIIRQNEELNREREEQILEEEAELRERETENLENENSERIPADNEPEPVGPNEPLPTVSPESNLTPKGAGWSAHGKEFPGATNGRIATTGKQGDKAYVEYAVTFPGRIEHWRYFTASGNWQKVSASNEGGGANKGGSTTPKNPTTTIGIGPGHALPALPSDPANPRAVNTGNQCVSGGVGGHTAPKGYHLYCGPGGWIFRAPDAGSVTPAKPTPTPAAPPPPAPPPVCPAGTVANIQQSRAEVNRLTSEIQTLQGYIQAHPNAKQVNEWRANIANKQANRDQFQGAVDRGHQVPGCAGV